MTPNRVQRLSTQSGVPACEVLEGLYGLLSPMLMKANTVVLISRVECNVGAAEHLLGSFSEFFLP